MEAHTFEHNICLTRQRLYLLHIIKLSQDSLDAELLELIGLGRVSYQNGEIERWVAAGKKTS